MRAFWQPAGEALPAVGLDRFWEMGSSDNPQEKGLSLLDRVGGEAAVCRGEFWQPHR